MFSALEHPKVVETYLGEECRAGRILVAILSGGDPRPPHQTSWGDPERKEHGQMETHH